MQVERDNWVLDVTDEWAVTQHPECLTLELSDIGALQFSSATKRSGHVDHVELLRIAENESDGWGNPETVSFGDFSGFLYRYSDADRVIWLRAFASAEATVLFVTYNTEIPISTEHEKLIQSTLHTLRLRTKEEHTA